MGKFEVVEGALQEAPYQFERDLSRFRRRYGLSCPEYIKGAIVQFVQIAKIVITRELAVGNVLKLARRCPVRCRTTTRRNGLSSQSGWTYILSFRVLSNGLLWADWGHRK